MKYSYNQDRKEIIFASTKDLNASFKDLCAVCDSVRYMPVPSAISVLDGVINDGKAIEYRRHNRYMGSRHELGGKKGRYPKKCAAIVRKVLINATANAKNKGEDPDSMFVVHASANKTQEVPRMPPKGIRSVRAGSYGYTPLRRSNLSFAKLEIGIASKDLEKLGAKMKRVIKAVSKNKSIMAKVEAAKKASQPVKKAKKSTPAAPKPAAQTTAPTPTPKATTTSAPAPTTTTQPTTQTQNEQVQQ